MVSLGVVRVGQANVSMHFRFGTSGSAAVSFAKGTISSFFSGSVLPQANMMHRLRPRVFSTAASPTSATVGLSSLVIGAMITLEAGGLGLLSPKRCGKRPGGGGGLGVLDRDGLVTSPSLVNSAVEAMLAVL